MCALWLVSLPGSSTEPAMNGTSGFQEVQSSSPDRQPGRFLHEQRHQCGEDSWHFLRIYDLSTLSTDIRTSREKATDTIFIPQLLIQVRFCVLQTATEDIDFLTH
jgi:hypothetical protein